MNIINRKRNLYKFRRITKKKRLHSKKGDKIENKFETNINLKHYWTDIPYFIQGSNYGLDKSTIQ